MCTTSRHFARLFFSLSLAITAQSASAKQTAQNSTPSPVLGLALTVESAADATGGTDSAAFLETLLLTLRNDGNTNYELPSDLQHVWKITLHVPDADPTELSSLSWSNAPQVGSLAPQEVLRSQTTIRVEINRQDGTYMVEAEFLPTHGRAFEKLALPSPSTLNLLFTGKLMGYYRLPDRQSYNLAVEAGSCPLPDPDAGTPFSHDANTFLQAFPANSRKDAILVGMGDNFAPNYYSRVFNPAPPGRPHQPGKDLYVGDAVHNQWDWYQNTPLATRTLLRSGNGRIPTDNVACFLSFAHYAALVPGKHDFYYGPERLRELARFLANIPEDTHFKRVEMLAANMVIKTTWAKDHTPIPDSGKHALDFVTKYRQEGPPTAQYQNLEIADFTDGGFVFPWMQFVRVTATGWSDDSLTRLQVCLCEAFKNPDDFLTRLSGETFCNREHALLPDISATRAARADGKTSGENPVPTGPLPLVYRIPEQVLLPHRSYAVCTFGFAADQTTEKTKPYCVRFSVFEPFFQSNWPRPGHVETAGSYADPLPYVVRDESGTEPVVIFGVVAPLLLERVGGDNLAWKTVRVDPKNTATAQTRNPSAPADPTRVDKRYNTEITIADPVQALVQLQDYFESAHPTFHGVRVLLAQMPPEQAKELAEHLPKCLRFDVVVSEADDALATPNQIVQIRPAALAGNDIPACPNNAGASGLKMSGEKSNFVNGSLVSPPAFVAVPPTHESSSGDNLSRFVQVRRLHLTTRSNGHTDYVLSGEPIPVPVPDTKPLFQASTSFWLAVCRAVYRREATKECKAKETLDANNMLLFSQPQLTDSSLGKNRPVTVNWDSTVKKTAVQQVALWAMRERWHADVALLQERDFYIGGFEDYLAEHCRPEPDPTRAGGLKCASNSVAQLDLQEILDRIIWKGDYLRVRSVPGSVLKSILKQSDAFSKSQKTVYLPLAEANRPLVKLGLWPDPINGGDFLVNGKALDPAGLYTVVTSDYIELGDTGYPDLATPPVGDPSQPASSSGNFTTISNAACKVIETSGFASGPNDVPRLLANCEGALQRKDYYDELANRIPDDPRAGNTYWHQLFAWSIFQPHLGQPIPKRSPGPPGPDDIANQMQKRIDAQSNWDWSFDKLSIGFSSLSHSYSEQDLSNNFGGVQNAQVNAKHTHSWDWDANSKYTLYHPYFDWFAQEGLQYSSNFVAQTSGPRSETQSRNLFAVDGGAYLHLWSPWGPWKNKSLPQLSLVLSGHFETQPGNPITSIKLNAVPPSTSSQTLTFQQGRTDLLLGRSGLRWQERKSYIEGGLEGGKTLNAIQQFNVLVAPGGPSVPCMLEASLSLTNCLNAFNKSSPSTPVTASSQVTVLRHPQARYGAYWTMGLTVPASSKVSYNFQETSDFFFLSSGDNSADTRFRHQFVNTLKFNVFANLSFEPTYTIFLYENKVDYHFLLQQQFSVKINYSFDCSNWHECRNEFRYKKPSPQ